MALLPIRAEVTHSARRPATKPFGGLRLFPLRESNLLRFMQMNEKNTLSAHLAEPPMESDINRSLRCVPGALLGEVGGGKAIARSEHGFRAEQNSGGKLKIQSSGQSHRAKCVSGAC